MSRLSLILLFTFLQAGCATVHQQMDLAHSSWRVEDISGQGVLDRVAPTVIFRSGGQLIATGGCNRFFGSWRLEGNQLTVRDVAGTKMACPEGVMHQEELFLDALRGTRRISTENGDVLILVGEGQSLRLYRADPS